VNPQFFFSSHYIMVQHIPNVYISGRIHPKKLGEGQGRGMGSVLLNVGGAGSGSSYPSTEDYTHTTGVPVPQTSRGAGLGGKLSKLVVKPLTKKPQNIKFSL
jgi:hypothetical protein